MKLPLNHTLALWLCVHGVLACSTFKLKLVPRL